MEATLENRGSAIASSPAPVLSTSQEACMGSRFRGKWQVVGVAMSVATMFWLAQPAHAATISWKGHTWNVTSGGMAGVCQGNTANVFIDASGYLHMKITNNGAAWTAAEIFSTDKIGFGTYQWQIEGPTDKLDKNVVVGLYPYGPAAGLGSSGNNEIDIEFARWGNDAWPNGNYTIWPPTGSTTGSHTFTFSLGGGTSITTRFTWSSTQIDFATLKGFVAVDVGNDLIDAWTFAPANPTTRITQEAMPLGMNLWCFDNPPSDGQNVEIIVRDFQFVPLGSHVDAGAGDAGEAGSATNSDGAGAEGGQDGSTGPEADVGNGGAGGTGGATGSGGSASGGAVGAGGTPTGGAVGFGGSATAETARVGGSTGASGTGGVVATGGAGIGAGGSGGAVGTTSSGAAAGNAGLAGSSGAAGGAGAPSTGGVASSGGASGATGVTAPAGSASGGCGCGVAGARTALGGHMLLLAVALLFARRFHPRRPR
jgi:MYXO-CTERM domain-containing protein